MGAAPHLREVSLQPPGPSGSGELRRGEKILITLVEAGLSALGYQSAHLLQQGARFANPSFLRERGGAESLWGHA